MGADKAYDGSEFIAAARGLNVIVYVAKNDKGRRRNLHRRRTTRHPGPRYQPLSSMAGLQELRMAEADRHHPPGEAARIFVFSCAAHNLMRLPRLIE